MRREGHEVRRSVLLALGVVGVAGFALSAFVACEDWPPGKRGEGTGSSSGAPGTCSGTPTPCAALTTLQCGSTPGCSDQGSCGGTPASVGASCVIRSPSECNATPGCFWTTLCSGTPYGTCSASTQDACLLAPGCVWTPYTGVMQGTGGASGSCQSYTASCTTTANCDCGYSCVFRCPGCTGICGDSCQTDADCNGTTGLGFATPYCQFAASGSGTGTSGICAVTR